MKKLLLLLPLVGGLMGCDWLNVSVSRTDIETKYLHKEDYKYFVAYDVQICRGRRPVQDLGVEIFGDVPAKDHARVLHYCDSMVDVLKKRGDSIIKTIQ